MPGWYKMTKTVTLSIWGQNPNHALQKLKLLEGENCAVYLGAGKANTNLVFSIDEIRDETKID
jgi:hypothetical protein